MDLDALNPSIQLRVLILTPSGVDASNCAAVMTQQGIATSVCLDLASAVEEIKIGAGALLIAEEGLVGSLAAFKCILASQDPWSDLPIILLASAKSLNTNSLAEEISLTGNITLLERPLKRRNLLSAIRAALRARARQYEVYNMLKQRDNFLAMLGHELRNPLSPIRNGLHVLKKCVNNPQLERVHAMMDRQTNHLSRIVDDLLDVGRIISGNVVLKKEPLNISRVVRNVTEDQRPNFETKGVHLVLEHVREDVWVLGDETRLTQIMTNVLVNSLKFTDNGSVRILCQVTDIIVMIRIIDTGVGIAPSRIGRLFDIFYQADETLARTRGGLGLGLALCKNLMDLHGGSIAAISGGEGLGSEFVLTFPRHSFKAVPQTESAPDPVSRTSRILIVEDNVDVAESLQFALQLAGYEVNLSYDGTSGIAVALQKCPDVVICDIGLPGNVSGLDVARRLKKESSARLIALSGYGQPSDLAASREAGFATHLIKAVNISSLLEVISTVEDA